MRMPADTSPKGFYEEMGFYVHDAPLFPEDLVRRAVAGMDAIREGRYETGISPEESYWNPGDAQDKLCKIEMPQFANRAILELVSFPGLGRLAAEITGARMVQAWWVQLLYKPPAAHAAVQGTNVGWHQDRQYWDVWTPESELFTAWVALSDVTAGAGPMVFVPRSHRWGVRNEGDFFSQDLLAQRGGMRLPEEARWMEVPAILPPGGVSFHDQLTFHASGPNLSGAPRRSIAIHLRTGQSRPVLDKLSGLARYIDDPGKCPILYGG